MKGRFLSIILALTMLVSTLGTPGLYRAETKEVELEETESAGKTETVDESTDSDNTGLLENGDGLEWQEDLSFAGEEDSLFSRNWGTLPESYSSSAYVDWEFEEVNNWVTSIKTQDAYATDWAHATISAAETSYIKNKGIEDVETVDFNEYHLRHFIYNTPEDLLGLFCGDYNMIKYSDMYENAPGNAMYTTMTLANWIGLSDAKDFTAEDVDGKHPNTLGYEDAAHLEDVYYVAMPDMSTDDYLTDMENAKNIIMETGSLIIEYGSYADGGDELEGYYYLPVAEEANHAVVIVGWDDSITASTFYQNTGNKPAGSGAWLVKNSWGTNGELGGYFWLSYYDKSIASVAHACEVTDADNYDNNYQYDGSIYYKSGYMSNSSGTSGSTEIVHANAFVADSEETLTAVGFYNYNRDIVYEIQIYRHLEEEQLPQEGVPVHTQMGQEKYAGYRTIELDEPIHLMEGERYAVVIRIIKPNYYGRVYMAVARYCDYDYEWIYCEEGTKSGQSYWGPSVEKLEDISSYGYNARIKAFTNEGIQTLASGECGDNLSWKLDTQGSLIISGSGAMWDFAEGASDTPWIAYKDSIKNVYFQNTVTSVGNYAFDGFSNIHIVKLSTKMTSLGDGAFRGLINLKKIEFPKFLETIGTECFADCDSLATLELPELLESVGKDFCKSCDILYYVYIGNKLDDAFMVNGHPFSGCKALHTVEIAPTHKTLKNVGGDIFTKDGKTLLCHPAGTYNSKIIVPDGTERIADCAFEDSYHLREVIIPESVKSIGDYVFQRCDVLVTLVIPSAVEEIGKDILNGTMSATIVKNYSNAKMELPSNDGLTWMDESGNSITSITNGIAMHEVEEIIEETEVCMPYEEKELESGEYFWLYAMAGPEEATFRDVTYESLDPSIATVDGFGFVWANKTGKAGTTTIVATSLYKGVTGTCEVTVSPVLVESIELETNLALAYVEDQFTINIQVNPSIATCKDVRWISLDEDIATVDSETGLITALAPGEVYLIVEALDGSGVYEQICLVILPKEETYVEIESIDLNEDYLLLDKGDTFKLEVIFNPEDATDKTIYWKSGDEKVATVDENGNVTAVGYGETTITAKHPDLTGYKGGTASCFIRVSKQGLRYNDDGVLTYYGEDGRIDYSYFGLVTYEGRDYYVRSGRAWTDKKGVLECGDGWYLFDKGYVQRKTTLASNSSGWWYINNGEVDFTYDGVANYDGKTWYIENGKVDFSKKGLHQRGNTWYYFKDGYVDYSFTGLTNSSVGWWYIEKGTITFKYTGLVQYGGSWWYVSNSQLNFKYDGVANHNGSTWYIEDSKVDFKKNGLHQRGKNWYYFKNGAVNYKYTGLTNSSVGWWYIEKGTITFKYTGLTNYNGSWWYVSNSQLNFKYDGVAYHNGATWYIEDSKVDFKKNGLHQRGGIWYLFKNGAVNKIDSVEYYGGSWWYVDDGIIDFDYNGIGSNASGLWYIKNGKVDFSYSGTYEFEGKTYRIVNGKVV